MKHFAAPSFWDNYERLPPNIQKIADECYWLYIVTNCLPAEASAQACDSQPTLQEPIKDPARFPWREVTKVAHYQLEVNAMTRPMMVREDEAPYGKREQ